MSFIYKWYTDIIIFLILNLIKKALISHLFLESSFIIIFQEVLCL